jgi:3-oxoacyl-[acyl-carrier-protein] synthase-3
MNPFGIQAIGVHAPAEGLDSFALGAAFDASPDFIEQKLGFRSLRRKAAGEECSDLCVRAYQDLLARAAGDLAAIDCVAVVTQNPDGGGIPHASAVVHRKLDLNRSVACFDISLGCTGYVHGLSILCGFLRENDFRAGLLFTSDPYSRIINPVDRDTVLLFGDAATCTYVSCQPRYRPGKTTYLTDGRWAEAIQVPDRAGYLQMNGNQVFRFVAKDVTAQIRHCLAANACTEDDIDLFLVHQGSKYIVDTLAAALKVPQERMPFAAGQLGNTVSSSLPWLLADQLETPKPAKRILLSGFGVGLASATTVLFRMQED